MLLKTPNSPVTLPSLRESVAISRDKNLKAVEKHKLPQQSELMNFMARMGKPMHHAQFFEAVRKLSGYKLWAEEAVRIKWLEGKSMWSLYYTKGDKKVQVPATVIDAGYVPEYTIITETDDHGLPTKMMRGWRDVLVKLIQGKHLTKKQVLKHFGSPTPTNLDRWDQNLQKFTQ